MKLKPKNINRLKPLAAVIGHVGLGILASVYRPAMGLYLVMVFAYFIYRFLTKPDKEKEILVASAYMAGAEVFFRMTKAMFFYETGKYAVILFLLFGMFYTGFKRKAYPYVLYILLLLPGVILALEYYSDDLFLFRKNVLFNLSGPLCLMASALYCYGRRISFTVFLQLLDAMLYPIIAMTVYIYLYAPDIQSVVTGTASNSATSGGFGPNQVSTVLGLGVFILFTRLLLPYKNKLVQGVMLFFLVAMAHRALLTFSRGGVYVAILMASVFVFFFFQKVNVLHKAKLIFKIGVSLLVTLGIWGLAVSQTGGLLENRYANENAAGVSKDDVTTGRWDLFLAEIQAFIDHPFLGGGVGSSKVYHEAELGEAAASHNEISRIIGEHGLLGIIALCIILGAPLIRKLQGQRNLYFYPFLIFAFLTMAHSSMRIALPGFIYGLALLHLTYGKKKTGSPVPRQSLAKTW